MTAWACRTPTPLKAGKPRLLGVDNPIYVPVNKVVEVDTVGADVIHSWAMPQMGVKMDAVPGRINKTWFKATRPACSTASAPNCAARATPICRSNCMW